MSNHESFPSTIAMSLATAVVLANASCGPRAVGTTDPKAARAAFTSKLPLPGSLRMAVWSNVLRNHSRR